MNKPFVLRALHCLPAESAHHVSLKALRLGGTLGLLGRYAVSYDPSVSQRLLGLDFPHPLGLAAGYDKNASAISSLHQLGFSSVEIGSVTPKPQLGNPKPRVFRLLEDEAVINRYGFNSEGMERVHARVSSWQAKQYRQDKIPRRDKTLGLLGINLGKNKETSFAVEDYCAGARTFTPYADYLVINISSPNTPGLRQEQDPDKLAPLFQAVREAVQETAAQMEETGAGLRQVPPILVKLAPDLSLTQEQEIAEVVLSESIDGLLISNTTLARGPVPKEGETSSLQQPLQSALSGEIGGLSGRPLFDLSTECLRRFHSYTQGKIPLIGVGGIDSAQSAYAKIKAGASLVQIYSGLVYQGPGLVKDIVEGLPALLEADGFTHISQAIGQDT